MVLKEFWGENSKWLIFAIGCLAIFLWYSWYKQLNWIEMLIALLFLGLFVRAGYIRCRTKNKNGRRK
jgi:NADH:ubiquinone oxidoreductase subunit 3 (subunit A)